MAFDLSAVRVPVLDVDLGGMRVSRGVDGVIIITVDGVARDITNDPVIEALAWEVQRLREQAACVADGYFGDLGDGEIHRSIQRTGTV